MIRLLLVLALVGLLSAHAADDATKPVEAIPTDSSFNAVLADYDRQISGAVGKETSDGTKTEDDDLGDILGELDETPGPSDSATDSLAIKPEHTEKSMGLSSLTANARSKRASQKKRIQRYAEAAEHARATLHSELEGVLGQVSEFLASFREAKKSREATIDEFKHKAKQQISEAALKISTVQSELKAFAPQVKEAGKRIKEYVRARDKLLATAGPEPEDESIPLQLQEIETALDQAEEANEDITEAIQQRKEVLQELDSWKKQAQSRLASWLESETSVLEDFIKRGRARLASAHEAIEDLQGKYKEAVRLHHNYQVILHQYELRSEAIMLEKKMQSLRVDHEKLLTGIRVATRHAQDFTDKEQIIHNTIEKIDRALDEIQSKGEIELTEPPAFWSHLSPYESSSGSIEMGEDPFAAPPGVDMDFDGGSGPSASGFPSNLPLPESFSDPNVPVSTSDQIDRALKHAMTSVVETPEADSTTSPEAMFPPAIPKFAPLPSLESI